jgi:endonuclease/exonuclease/phosphatase (EEP) superfamily protein YafD
MSFARLVLTALLAPSVLVIAAACAIAAVLAQLGRWSAGWDILAHGAPFYLALGLVALAAALAFQGRYRTLIAGAGLLAVLAAALLITPEYLRSTGPRAPAGTRPVFKVVQFNAWDGRGDLPAALAWLAAEKPDVVVIEEINRQLRLSLTAAGWHAVHGRSGVMLFTRDPPIRSIIPTDNETGPMQLNGVVLATPAGETTVLGVHYPWPNRPDLAPEARAWTDIARRLAAPTTIIAGDFNSTPWSFTRRREDREFGLIRRDRALASWPTGRAGLWRWPAPFPFLPIDHVYAGSAWATVSVKRGPRLGSDHYPIVMTLAPVAPH